MRPLPVERIERIASMSSRIGHGQQRGTVLRTSARRPVAGLTFAQIDAKSGLPAPRPAATFAGFQQPQDRRVVEAHYIHGAGRGIGGRAAPYRTAVVAGDLHRVDEADGSEKAIVAGLRQPLLERVAVFGRHGVRIDIVRRELLAAERRGMLGNGCVGHACSPGIVALGDRAAPRSARSALPVTRSKTYRNPVLPACATTSMLLAVPLDRDELGRGVVVVVPEIVVHHLEMPEPLAGSRVERERGNRRTGWRPADPRRRSRRLASRSGSRRCRVLSSTRDFSPGVDAADVLPGVLRPRLVAELAGMGTCGTATTSLPVTTS